MHLVKSTTARLKRIFILSFALFFYSIASAQDNSPYSRYGLGDAVINQNITYRGMGGVSIADANIFAVNFKNPASLGIMSNRRTRRTNMIFDIGGEIDIRTLKSTAATNNDKYTSTNTNISYLQLAFPIATKKMEKKGITWGMAFGIRPVTRINYRIEKNERLPGIDSLQTLYEGHGGVSQVNVSTGLKIRNFSIGISSGFTFGNRHYGTQLIFINDTVPYLKSNSQSDAHFGGLFLNTGIQYEQPLKNKGFLRFGAYANLKQSLRARQDQVNETFSFTGTGSTSTIDTITAVTDQAGTVKLPASYGFGVHYQDGHQHWTIGADFEMTNWESYSYYGQKDNVQNSWIIRLGAEYYPVKNNTPAKKYWHFVKYRAGFYLGPEYAKVNTSLLNYAATVGASLPLTSLRLLNNYSGGENQYVLFHTSIEYGGRGDNQSFSFKENTWRFAIGISMNALWFQKRNYY